MHFAIKCDMIFMWKFFWRTPINHIATFCKKSAVLKLVIP